MYQGLKQLQQAGEHYHKEKAELIAKGDFKYSLWDAANDRRSRHDKIATKISGAGNLAGGSAVAVGSIGGGVALCTTGKGCVIGAPLAIAGGKAGYDQAKQGTEQLINPYQSRIGEQVVQSLGTPVEYNSPLVSDAKNLAVWGLEALVAKKAGRLFDVPQNAVNPSKLPQPESTKLNLNSQKTVANKHIGIHWGGDINKQGMPWEDYVGNSLPADARLPRNFKTFDYYDLTTKTAISAKTLDTQTPSRLAKPEQIYGTMKGYIDSTANFTEYELSRRILTADMIKQREIHLAVPADTNAAQRIQLQRVIEYGKSRNIDVKITEVE